MFRKGRDQKHSAFRNEITACGQVFRGKVSVSKTDFINW
jgi:hypothetical protein